MKRYLLLTLILLPLFGPRDLTLASAQLTPAGHWEGYAEIEGMKLAFNIDLSQKEGGAWMGSITIAAQQLKDRSLDKVSVAGRNISFEVTGVPGNPVFKGKLSEDGKVISGDITQSGKTIPFKLDRKAKGQSEQAYGQTPDKGIPGQGVEGFWQGTLDTGGTKLRVILKLLKASDGTLAAKLDSPDQGITDLPVDEIAFKDRRLRFAIKRIGAVYEGALDSDGSELSGQWRQGGISFPLAFRRLDRKAGL
jgi:uncharacterized protein